MANLIRQHKTSENPCEHFSQELLKKQNKRITNIENIILELKVISETGHSRDKEFQKIIQNHFKLERKGSNNNIKEYSSYLIKVLIGYLAFTKSDKKTVSEKDLLRIYP